MSNHTLFDDVIAATMATLIAAVLVAPFLTMGV
jgi:hypothetical protein